MNKTTVCRLLLPCALVATGLLAGPESAAPAAQKDVPVQIEAQSVTVEATVEAVDLKTRMVTLRGADGKTVTVKAGDEVKRLSEVKKGDVVVAEYYESLVMAIAPDPAAAPTAAAMGTVTVRNPPSETPAGGVVSQIEATVEILAIDRAAETVTVKGPEGNATTVHARHPENLDKIKVGDKVHIVYTESLAIGIVPKKPAVE